MPSNMKRHFLDIPECCWTAFVVEIALVAAVDVAVAAV